MSDDLTEEEKRVYAILDAHPLDCRCTICRTYVNAMNPRLGLAAAAEMLKKIKTSPFSDPNPKVH